MQYSRTNYKCMYLIKLSKYILYVSTFKFITVAEKTTVSETALY